MKAVLAPLGDKPLKTAAMIFLALVVARIAGEFGAGVIDGFIAEITNGV